MRPDRRALLAGLAALPLIGAAPRRAWANPISLNFPCPRCGAHSHRLLAARKR